MNVGGCSEVHCRLGRLVGMTLAGAFVMGCAMPIGFTMGAVNDARDYDRRLVECSDLATVETGTLIYVKPDPSSRMERFTFASYDDSTGILVVQSESDTMEMPCESLYKLRSEKLRDPGPHHAKWRGLLIGLGVDVVAAIALISFDGLY